MIAKGYIIVSCSKLSNYLLLTVRGATNRTGEIQKESMSSMPVVILSIIIPKNLLFLRRLRVITAGTVAN